MQIKPSARDRQVLKPKLEPKGNGKKFAELLKKEMGNKYLKGIEK